VCNDTAKRTCIFSCASFRIAGAEPTVVLDP
jgi:hypothetical protein